MVISVGTSRICSTKAKKRRYQRLTTVMDLQPAFPAASYARMVTVLVPTSNGTSAVQVVVPAAVPAAPVEVVNFTAGTYTDVVTATVEF